MNITHHIHIVFACIKFVLEFIKCKRKFFHICRRVFVDIANHNVLSVVVRVNFNPTGLS